MRIYSASSEEILRARRLLADWAGEGFLTQEQHQRLQQETNSELRTTNIFLRLVLFLFTLVCVAAIGGLFYKVFIDALSDQSLGIFLLIYACVCYAAAEVAVSHGRLYRHGIEEALAVCSVACLCLGMQLAVLSGRPFSSQPDLLQCVVPAAGAISSLWIWRRFGLWYAFAAAMVFTLFVPDSWTASRTAQHVIVASLYAVGLVCVIAIRSRQRVNYVEDDYSLAEAFLWSGIYLALNLQLSWLNLRGQFWGSGARDVSGFSASFYWTTWVLIWCLPALVLARGVRLKDRFVMAVGAISFILTFVTNKPYLGWSRHTWDPMLLGIVLVSAAWLVRRWLDRGPGGVRHGFTAARLSGKDKLWMNASSIAVGLVAPQSIAPSPRAGGESFDFGGGASGGGGAGGDF